MQTKRWKLVVTDLGGGHTLSEVTAEGDNWMQALAAGRARLGDGGALPPGASCVPMADGGVAVLDAQSRRRYVLSPSSEGPGVPNATAEPGARPAPPAEPAGPGAVGARPRPAKKRIKKTVAYMPSPVAEPAPPAPSRPGKVSKKTVAYMSPFAIPASASSPPSGPPPAEEQPGDTGERGAGWELLNQRDEEPSEENPLRYRERIFVVPAGTSVEQADAVLRDRFEALRDELADTPPGKFFNLAVFDHAWHDRPDRPPLTTLQWKDWRGEPIIEHPAPPPPSPAARRQLSSMPPHPGSTEADARLAHAFEACQDLLFLTSPVAAVEFVIRLLAELVPSEAAAGCLYDINADEQRVVFATGPGSDARLARGLPAKAGLLGASQEARGTVLRVDDVVADGRFEAEVEGREGLGVKSALYAPLDAQGHLLGMIQLLNRVGDASTFSRADADVAGYVAGQLAQFVRTSRASG